MDNNYSITKASNICPFSAWQTEMNHYVLPLIQSETDDDIILLNYVSNKNLRLKTET